MRCKFRFHYGVACLPAEGHAIHVVDGAIGKLRRDNHIDNGCHANKGHKLAQLVIAKVERRKLCWIGALAPAAATASRRFRRE